MARTDLSKIVNREICTATGSERLTGVIAEMVDRRSGCAIIVQRRKPIGIISEHDVVKLVSEQKVRSSTPVRDVMSSPVSVIKRNTMLEDAVRYARNEGFRQFPVVSDKGELVGIVTQSDIMDAAEKLLRGYTRELENRMEKASKRMTRLIMTDELTGLSNRRYVRERLKEEFDRCRRYSLPVSCLMVDIDHFKMINDEFGHPAGDTVLRRLAKLLAGNLRSGDICARVGGEEFLILLPHTMLSGALVVANRTRRTVADTVFRLRRKQMRITVSVGVCNLSAHGPKTANDFLRMADDALYVAKRKGRNRVESYGSIFHDVKNAKR